MTFRIGVALAFAVAVAPILALDLLGIRAEAVAGHVGTVQ
jgi:hypothetical protein